ncbi:MAG: glycerol-3-phosphate acyltransferase [Candidatus Babeliales bacterium]
MADRTDGKPVFKVLNIKMLSFLVLISVFISCLFLYLVGSVPTGYWFAKYFFNIDITGHGSGNIGASNIGRVLGKKYFVFVFLIDFLKAFISLYIVALFILVMVPFSCGFCCVQKIFFLNFLALLFGNAYSIFLNFKGGKGVATTAGILAWAFPFKFFMIFCCLWLLVLAIFRKPFLASLLTAYFACFIYYFVFFDFANIYPFYFLIFVCIWLTFRHRSNFKRI